MEKKGGYGVSYEEPNASFNANPMIPQTQKIIAKGILMSSGINSGMVADAVPKANRKAESDSMNACALLIVRDEGFF